MKKITLFVLFVISMITVKAQFAGGTGTIDDPYEIEDATQLNAVRDYFGGINDTKHFKLIADIDLNDLDLTEAGWEPIDGYGFWGEFYGVFDGDGHVIKNFWINRPDEDYVGLFAKTGGLAIIKNLRIECHPSKPVIGNNFTGILAGVGGAMEVYNCSIKGNVEGNTYVGGFAGYLIGHMYHNNNFEGKVSGELYVGGLGGQSHCVEIHYCNSNAEINGSNNVGGLVGDLIGTRVFHLSTLSNSYSLGTVNATGNNVGGLAGANSGIIIDCYSEANVIGAENVGGLIGLNSGIDAVIERCYAVCNIKGSYRVGGLVGCNNDTIKSSGTNVKVYGSGYVGGLIGYNNGTINKCFTMSNVEGDEYVGGLIGQNDKNVSESFAITDAYGKINYVGGLIGKNTSNGGVTSVFSHGAISSADGAEYVGGLIGRSDRISQAFTTIVNPDFSGYSFVGGVYSQYQASTDIFYDKFFYWMKGDPLGLVRGEFTGALKWPLTFNNFDFTNTWAIVNTCSYPYFKWQKTDTTWYDIMIQQCTPAMLWELDEWYGMIMSERCTGFSGFFAPAAPKSTDGGDLLGIDQVKEQTLSISPNPTTGIVNIKGNNVDVKVYDMQGRQIIQTKDKTIDLSTYPSGVYIFNINGKIEKIIKQ